MKETLKDLLPGRENVMNLKMCVNPPLKPGSGMFRLGCLIYYFNTRGIHEIEIADCSRLHIAQNQGAKPNMFDFTKPFFFMDLALTKRSNDVHEKLRSRCGRRLSAAEQIEIL